jgi:dTDP-4-amino-4,6-dideoxygalactose transaminase
MQDSLAVKGGPRVTDKPFNSKPTLTKDDISHAYDTLVSGCLSDFYGTPGPHFYGGLKVKELEHEWSELHKYSNCIAINSWTTGLTTCLKACKIGYGDEVICTPVTMSATASSVLECGAIPIFCDVDPITLNISPYEIEKAITSKTKAIMVVHLFGLPANMKEISEIATEYNLRIFEDAAHAPLAKYQGRFVGGLGDIGGFSLNHHKHIHCGEGGIIVTNDPFLAEKCRFIRNHGENALLQSEILKDEFVVGSNYRLTELQAAIAVSQLKRLDSCILHRNHIHSFLVENLAEFGDILRLPEIPSDRTHSFYCYPVFYNSQILGIGRDEFVTAVNSEFPVAERWDQSPLSPGYSQPLYTNPIYHRPAIDKTPFPVLSDYGDYYRNLYCRNAEYAVSKSLMLAPIVHEGNGLDKINLLVKAIKKVVSYYR